MWWLAIPAVVGAAAWIISELNDEAQRERQRWEAKREEVEQSLRSNTLSILDHLNEARQVFDFYQLVDLHYQSMLAADQAYILLKDARKSIDAIGKSILKAKKERDKFILERKQAKDKLKREMITKEIDSLVNLRKVLFAEKDKLKVQRDELYAEVKNLNCQTGHLKMAIKEKTGLKGVKWFQRMELRKMVRQMLAED